MNIERKELNVNGIPVLMTENPGQPLLMLVRNAARHMGLWDKIWEPLSRYFTLVNYDTTPANIEKFNSHIELFHHYSQEAVDVATGLGYEHFHILGWQGGAQIALRTIIDFPQHIDSCMLLGANYIPAETRPHEKMEQFWSAILERGDLELYTYWWLLNSFTPDYVEAHFDEIERLVNVRIDVDRGRLDTTRILKLVRMLRQQPASEEELANIKVPTLIVAPAFTRLSALRKLNALIKSSQLAIIPGNGVFVLLEDPDAFMWAVGPFLRAAVRGQPPAIRLAEEEGLTVLSGGNRVDVVEKRSDEAVVFLHGWLMSPQMWAHSMDALQDKIRCVALWQPGHGHSTAPQYEFSMEDWADMLIETLDNLNIKKAILVGHSMGGFLSMMTAQKYPDRVIGLVFVDTQDDTWDKPRNDNWLELVNTIAASWEAQTANIAAQLLMSEHFLNTHPAWLGEWTTEVSTYDLDGQRHLGRAIANRPDFSLRHHDIKVPVLVIHGTHDQAITIDVARAMVERIPGSQLEEIAGTGHCPPLEKPEEFTTKLVDFLKRKQYI